MENLRIIPSDWMGPLDLDAVFGHKPGALEVDLGCGKGRFLLAHAEQNPDISFLGIDRLLLRLLRVERQARREKHCNIRLLYVDACYAVGHLLPACSVAVYYIFFPDPWPKRRHYRRRLFDEDFLNALNKTLVPAGYIHVVTDHADYFKIIRGTITGDSRFETVPFFEPCEEERTGFELLFRHQQIPIHRCSFRKKLV